MSYQACVPQQCSALLVMPDDLKQELTKSQKGTITVYARLTARGCRLIIFAGEPSGSTAEAVTQ
jgi:hypothetical protein